MTARDPTPQSLRERALHALCEEIEACRRCPRLVSWREEVAREKRASYRGQEYWGRPVSGFGDPGARIAILGLAPAAHGANRTGRVFTGDRSGDFLFAALWRAGLANQRHSVARDDGLRLHAVWVSAAVRCAPPLNRPTPGERDACRPFSVRELALLPNLRVLIALGAFAWDAILRVHESPPRPRPRFAHMGEWRSPSAAARAGAGGSATPAPVLLGSYHVSQQNTFTGRLTEAMFDAVLARALELAG